MLRPRNHLSVTDWLARPVFLLEIFDPIRRQRRHGLSESGAFREILPELRDNVPEVLDTVPGVRENLPELGATRERADGVEGSRAETRLTCLGRRPTANLKSEWVIPQ